MVPVRRLIFYALFEVFLLPLVAQGIRKNTMWPSDAPSFHDIQNATGKLVDGVWATWDKLRSAVGANPQGIEESQFGAWKTMYPRWVEIDGKIMGKDDPVIIRSLTMKKPTTGGDWLGPQIQDELVLLSNVWHPKYNFRIFATPGTLLLPGRASVSTAAMFYLPPFKKEGRITWEGAPSLLFTPLRFPASDGALAAFTQEKIVFDIHSFASTACILDTASKEATAWDAKTDLQKINTLAKTCNKKKYRKSSALGSFTEQFRTKFARTFEDARLLLHMEQGALMASRQSSHLKADFDESRVVTMTQSSQRDLGDRTPFDVVMYNYMPALSVQRYNELVTRFFPWDIYGIEIGADPRFYFEVKDKCDRMRAELFECIVDAKNIDEFVELLKTGSSLHDNSSLMPSTFCASQLEIVAQYFQIQSEDGKISLTTEQTLKVLDAIIERLKGRLDPYRYKLDSVKGTSKMKWMRKVAQLDSTSAQVQTRRNQLNHLIVEDVRSSSNPLNVTTTNWCLIHEARLFNETSAEDRVKVGLKRFLAKIRAKIKARRQGVQHHDKA